MNEISIQNQIPLQELCHGIIDCPHSSPQWLNSGRLVIRNYNIKSGKLDLTTEYYTDEETFVKRNRKGTPESGDLIITREAPMGEVCMVPQNLECCLGQRMVLIKPDPNRIDNHYLLYVLQSQYLQKQIGRSQNSGSIVSNLRIPLLKQLSIPTPPLPTQRRIASVLSTLDEKIALNQRINTELEAIAKKLYDYWFVQFDFPDAEGRPYKSSGGKMVYSEKLKREIPEGWGVGSLGGFIPQIKKSINPSLSSEKLFKLFSIPHFDATGSFALEYGKEIGSNKYLVTSKAILVSKLNPWFSRVIRPRNLDDMICSTEFVVWQPEDQFTRNFAFILAKSEHFIAYCIQSATGTSNSHKRVPPTTMMNYSIPVNKALIKDYGKIINPFLDQISENTIQSQHLTRLRDWLLPMLMNGQVAVGA